MESSTPTPNIESFTNIINFKDLYLIKDNKVYKNLLGRSKNQILVKIQNYINHMSEQDLSTIVGKNINSLEQAYEFMMNSFEKNRISLKEIKINREIILALINESKEINIVLTYDYCKNCDDFVFNEIKQLRKEKIELKNEIDKLKKEINEIKNIKNEPKNEFGTTIKNYEKKVPKIIKFERDIIDESYAVSNTDHSFLVFKSINDLLYIIYSTIAKSLICYDIEKERKIKELKNYHNQFISGFRHYLDKIKNIDLIMSISCLDNNIKILNFNKWEEILKIKNINNSGMLYSACFLSNSNGNKIYILTSNRSKNEINEPIKVYNLKGEKLKEINNSSETTLLIDTYYDSIISKTYIISGNIGYAKSYDYAKNIVYHIYIDKECPPNFGHFGVAINEHKGKIELIDSCFDGILRVWNFHSGLLLKKIKVSEKGLRGICLWNDNYAFVGCDDNSFKLVELKNGLFVSSIGGNNNQVITIKKLLNYNEGNFLITQNRDKSALKLWRVENY